MRIVILLACLFLSGCSILKQPAVKITYYHLDYISPYPVVENSSTNSLMIQNFGIDAAYDRNSIIYLKKDNLCGFYNYSQWLTNPSALVTDAITRDFRNAKICNTIIDPSMFHIPNYLLNNEITLIGAKMEPESKKYSAVFSTTTTLIKTDIKNTKSIVIFQKEFSAASPIEKLSPENIVSALNISIKNVSSNMIAEVSQAIKK